jgi:hypothetical protein
MIIKYREVKFIILSSGLHITIKYTRIDFIFKYIYNYVPVNVCPLSSGKLCRHLNITYT